jgi:acyl-CoA synthetase (AMP-forming)/AMP-acid ligase II
MATPISTDVTQSVTQLLASRAAMHGDRTALLAPGREPLTYMGLDGQAAVTVSALNAHGVGRNDRVGVVLPNGPEMAAAFVSIAAGATCAPLNPAYRAEEFRFYLSDLDAKALVVDRALDSPAVGVAESLGIPVVELASSVLSPAGTFTLKALSGTAPASAAVAPVFAEADDIALVLHTSGTTSRPKIVPLSHSNVCASAANIARTLALTPEDRCLNIMPLFHIHGLMGAVLSSFTAGAALVATPGFDVMKFFGWLDEFKPTWYSAVPTMHQIILARAVRNREVVERSKLRLIRSSSAALPPQVMRELEQTFRAPVIESYGMTEAAHQMASNPLPPKDRKPGSVGIAAGPEVSVMNDAGDLLPSGETAEIVIRGDSVTTGYDKNPEANKAAFTAGWFRTGDQGYFDADGYLFITGRLKEIINRGGEKISPREVDEVLLDHPAVRQAITFAMPHRALGEDVAAAIVLAEGAAADAKQIRDFASERLAAFKVPSRVVFLDEIPKGPTGKLQRIGLAEKLGLTST